jgi:streptomycin 6-kinase
MKKIEENVLKAWGKQGQHWLKTCPSLAQKCASHWGLTHLTLVSNLSYNYVLTGIRAKDGLPIVLKIGFDPKEILQEASALQFYDGRGCVKLLAVDFEKGALLIERVQPGDSMVRCFPERESMIIPEVAKIFKQLHQQVKGDSFAPFPAVSAWLLGLERLTSYDQLFPYIDKARKQADFLLEAQTQPVLLHGDLHHDNLLWSNVRGWVAIDPKGVVGESAYEVGAFIRNPMPELLSHPSPGEVIRQRISLFSQYLSMDPDRLKQWSYVQAVLAAGWRLEDKADPCYFLDVADIIESC